MACTCSVCGGWVGDFGVHTCSGYRSTPGVGTYTVQYWVDNAALQRIAAALEALVARGGPLAAPSTERPASNRKVEGKRVRGRVSQTAPDKPRTRRRIAVPPRGAPRG